MLETEELIFNGFKILNGLIENGIYENDFTEHLNQDMPNKFESSLDWHRRMQSSADYLCIDNLHAGMAYAIWARNAYVGIWMPEEKGFLISRYKLSAKPFLSIEYHSDICEPVGTAKPLRPLECCPLVLPSEIADRDAEQNQELCAWLDALETRHPPCPGLDTVAERRQAVASWERRQAERRHPDAKRHAHPVWKMNV